MKLKLRDAGKLFKATFTEWNRKDPFRQSAVIAYYAIFSIPGLLVLIISVAGYFFGAETVNHNIVDQISHTLGPATGAEIKAMLINVHKSKSTILGSILGIGVLLLGATGVFVELQKTLNNIWLVKALPQKGIFRILKARLFSFGLILAIAFLLLVSLVISTALAAMNNWIVTDSSEFVLIIYNIFNFAISLGIISVLFALIFKILPDAKVKWKYVWPGALLTGILFTIGKTALAFYFARFSPASVYGAAASIILMLLWVSYSSMILFFGAEFTAMYATMASGRIDPTAVAKKIHPEVAG